MARQWDNRILSVTIKQDGLEALMKKENVGKLVDLVLKAVGLAMAVAVVVLNILKVATVETSILLLGIGMFGLAISSLDK
jgi:small-conductance mechanosensitive channel